MKSFKFYKTLNNPDKLIFVSIIIGIITVVVLFGATIYDRVGAETTLERVEIVDKIYTPSSTSTGIATGVTSGGNTATGVVTSSKAESYTLLIRFKNEVFSQKVEPEQYTRYRKGDKIRVRVAHGALGWSERLIFD